MIEVRNKTKGPIQIMVRSRTAPQAFTTLIIPGIGKGENVKFITDEQLTEYVERVEKMGFISTRYISNKNFKNTPEANTFISRKEIKKN